VFSESPMELPDLGFSCGVLDNLSFLMYNTVLLDEWFPVFEMIIVLVKYVLGPTHPLRQTQHHIPQDLNPPVMSVVIGSVCR